AARPRRRRPSAKRSTGSLSAPDLRPAQSPFWSRQMSFARRIAISVTTAADGSATVLSDPIDFGLLSQIRYVKNNFDDGSTITVTLNGTGETLWTESNVNASATRAPRQATHGTNGAASLFAAGGTGVQDKIAIANDQIKVVIASGGNVKSGTFYFLL